MMYNSVKTPRVERRTCAPVYVYHMCTYYVYMTYMTYTYRVHDTLHALGLVSCAFIYYPGILYINLHIFFLIYYYIEIRLVVPIGSYLNL